LGAFFGVDFEFRFVSLGSLGFHLDIAFYVDFLVDGSFACSGNLEKFLQGSPFLCFFLFTFSATEGLL